MMKKEKNYSVMAGYQWDGVPRLSDYVDRVFSIDFRDAQLQRQRARKWLSELPLRQPSVWPWLRLSLIASRPSISRHRLVWQLLKLRLQAHLRTVRLILQQVAAGLVRLVPWFLR